MKEFANRLEAGAWLRVLRKEKGWTQTQAAERIGVSSSYLHHLESGGTQYPGYNILMSMAKVYRITQKRMLNAFYPEENSTNVVSGKSEIKDAKVVGASK